jgi:outer membrane protein OmpA-like peptidoglycan-associated protein
LTTEVADEWYDKGEYLQAITEYERLIARMGTQRPALIDLDYVYGRIGKSYFYLRDYLQAEHYFEMTYDRDVRTLEIFRYYGDAALGSHHIEKARNIFQQGLNKYPENPDLLDRLRRTDFFVSAMAHPRAADNPVDFATINGNSKQFALAWYSGSLLFSSDRTRSEGDREEGAPTRFFRATPVYNAHNKITHWANLKEFHLIENRTAPLHSMVYDPNTETYYVMRCPQLSATSRPCNIYMLTTDRVTGKLSDYIPMPFRAEGMMTGHPTLSSDGRVMIFTASIGQQTELYISQRNETNGWSQPVKLESTINTAEGIESHPHLFQDSLLFFSSDGHLGMGGLDVFYSGIQIEGAATNALTGDTDLSKLRFTTPLNLGAPINSGADDVAFLMHPEGKGGFLISNRMVSGQNRSSIYSFSNSPYVLKEDGVKVGTPQLASKSLDTMVFLAPVPLPNNGQTIEYGISKNSDPKSVRSWQSEPVFTGLSAGDNYFIFARAAANDYFHAGTPSEPYAVTATLIAATFGDILATVPVPQNFKWENPNDLVGGAGIRTHRATLIDPTQANDSTPASIDVRVLVHKAKGAPVSTPSLSIQTHDRITINGVEAPDNGQGAEYAIARQTTPAIDPATLTDWQTGRSFTGLTPGTTYYIYARSKEKENYLAGTPSERLMVRTHAAAGEQDTIRVVRTAERVEVVTINDTIHVHRIVTTYIEEHIIEGRADFVFRDRMLTQGGFDTIFTDRLLHRTILEERLDTLHLTSTPIGNRADTTNVRQVSEHVADAIVSVENRQSVAYSGDDDEDWEAFSKDVAATIARANKALEEYKNEMAEMIARKIRTNHNIDSVFSLDAVERPLIISREYFCDSTNEWHLRNVWNDHITFANILFNINSHVLSPRAKREVDALVAALKKHPEIRVGINGHTCDLGTRELNQGLSERRAQSVYDVLRQNGIRTNRMTYAGYNYEMPIAPNDIEENRERNRRVEITIVRD